MSFSEVDALLRKARGETMRAGEGDGSGDANTQAVAALESTSATQQAAPKDGPSPPVAVSTSLNGTQGEPAAGSRRPLETQPVLTPSRRQRFRWELKNGRLESDERPHARAACVGVQGERNCFFCDEPLDLRRLHELNYVDIHHELPQGAPGRNHLEFLHLVHHGEHQRLAIVPTRDVGDALRGAEREKKTDVTSDFLSSFPSAVQPSRTDAYSNKKNHRCHKPYRKHIFSRILAEFKQRQKPEIDELNEEGAELVGEETNTTQRYMDRILAKNGPCQRDPENDELIIFRDAACYYLNLDELMEVFPVEGQMTVDPAHAAKLFENATMRMETLDLKVGAKP